jgi:hypothetical protein
MPDTPVHLTSIFMIPSNSTATDISISNNDDTKMMSLMSPGVDITTTVLQFIAKISQTVLRARIGHFTTPTFPPASSDLDFIEDSSKALKASRGASTPSESVKNSHYSYRQYLSPSLSPSWLNVEDWLGRDDHWKDGIPINVDIFTDDRRILLERWVVTYEPSS